MFTPYLIQIPGSWTATVNPHPAHRLYRLCAAADHDPDKANLNGKVTVNDITETARKYIPEMRAKGADVVVVVAHSGLSADPYQAMAENSVYYLSRCPAWTPLCSAMPTRCSG